MKCKLVQKCNESDWNEQMKSQYGVVVDGWMGGWQQLGHYHSLALAQCSLRRSSRLSTKTLLSTCLYLTRKLDNHGLRNRVSHLN